jgi:hypothetical protein
VSGPIAGSKGRPVVNLVGDRHHGQLAESRLVDRPFLPGGEYSMYQPAFAAAAVGREVELRGWLDRTLFHGLVEATDVAPRVGLPARMPPSGWSTAAARDRLSALFQ